MEKKIHQLMSVKMVLLEESWGREWGEGDYLSKQTL